MLEDDRFNVYTFIKINMALVTSVFFAKAGTRRKITIILFGLTVVDNFGGIAL
jgi:hypothetical protein